jgi:CMP-N,N'-diacetyllegionaminic acid synthase
MAKVLALIPARSGSVGIPDKNVREVAGKPLMAWSIEHALAAESVDRVIVSTDSAAYAELARSWGAECPFLRPAAIAGSLSTDLEAFVHALDWLREHEGYEPDICVHLRPTCPVRRPGLIDELVALLQARPELDSVRTVTEVLHPPFKMWWRGADGGLSPILPPEAAPGIAEPWNEPRQNLPTAYVQTANVDVVRTRVIRKQRSMNGRRIHGYVEPEFFDVDVEAELARAAGRLEAKAAPISGDAAGPKTYCFDIDGVLATITSDGNYATAGPRPAMIAAVRRLHAAGHRIILCTARGTMTGIDWRAVTEDQMRRWDVPYHELHFGKPAADYYVDDRMLAMDALDTTMNQHSDGDEA